MSIFSELKASCPGLIPDAVEGPALTEEPLSALEKMGLFGEHLTQCILAFEGLNEPDCATQIARLNMLSNCGFLPLMLLPFFHVLNTKDRTTGIPHTSLQMRLVLVLKIAERLAIWFMKSYAPHLLTDAKRAQDVDGVIKSIRENPPSDRVRRSARRSATRRANTMQLSEGETRVIIDFQLRASGWQADSLTLRYSQGTRPEKGVNKAIAEWQTESGPADYTLFAEPDFVGVVESGKYEPTSPISTHVPNFHTISTQFPQFPISQFNFSISVHKFANSPHNSPSPIRTHFCPFISFLLFFSGSLHLN